MDDLHGCQVALPALLAGLTRPRGRDRGLPGHLTALQGADHEVPGRLTPLSIARPGVARALSVPARCHPPSRMPRFAADRPLPPPRLRLPGPRIGHSHPLGCGLWSGTSTAPPLGVHADAAGSAARCGRRTFRRGRGPQSWTPGAGSVRRCARARLHEPAVGRITLAAWCPNARGDARGAEGKEERP